MVYFKVFVLVLCLSGVFAQDEYIKEVQEECKTNRDFVSCGKYEALTLISNATSGIPTDKIDGIVNIVTTKNPTQTPDGVFSGARQMPGDSEVKKFFKFILRQADAYIGSRSISIALPEDAQIVDAEEPTNEIGNVFLAKNPNFPKKKQHFQILMKDSK